MALFGALLLVLVAIVRPQEFIPSLEKLSPLNLLTAIALLGIAIESFSPRTKQLKSPQFNILAIFVGWVFLDAVIKLGGQSGFKYAWSSVGLSTIFLLIAALACQSFARFRTMVVMLMGVSILIAAVGIHQGQQESECLELPTTEDVVDQSEGTPTGIPCHAAYECEQTQGARQGVDYACEKVGLFGTTSQGRRVRWRGTLGDPNEFALFLGICMPFFFAMHTIMKKKAFLLFLLPALAVLLYGVVLSGSRGGQLVVLTVFGMYFVRKYGAKGVIVGAILAVPVLLLGGREGSEADASAAERASLLYDGIDMFRGNPIFGVGIGQFNEESTARLTAHNSYLLAASELGFPGMLAWTVLVYISIKIPFKLGTRPPVDMDPRLQPLAIALTASYAGMLVGIFFLSFCYKALLFIFFGLSGALYAAAKKTSPELSIGVSQKEVLRILVADIVIIIFIFVYSRLKGAA